MARPPKLSDEALTAALADHPGSTAADLSKLLGVGQSTVAWRLAALEATGEVRRTPGDRVEGVPVPDHWSALRTAEPTPVETAAEGPGRESPAGRLGRGGPRHRKAAYRIAS